MTVTAHENAALVKNRLGSDCHLPEPLLRTIVRRLRVSVSVYHYTTTAVGSVGISKAHFVGFVEGFSYNVRG